MVHASFRFTLEHDMGDMSFTRFVYLGIEFFSIWMARRRDRWVLGWIGREAFHVRFAFLWALS